MLIQSRRQNGNPGLHPGVLEGVFSVGLLGAKMEILGERMLSRAVTPGRADRVAQSIALEHVWLNHHHLFL